MKRHILVLLAVFCFASVSFAEGFEGVITMSMKNAALGDKSSKIVMSMKGEKLLVQMDAGPVGAMDMYINKAQKKIYTVMPSMQMGYEIDMPDDKETKDAGKMSEPTPTGKKETINGYDCSEYRCTLDYGEMHLWLTKDLEPMIKEALSHSSSEMMKASSQGASNPMQKLFEQGLVSIRTVIMKDGKELVTTEFLSFEKKSLSDSQFEVPSGINLMKLPAGMGGMGR